MGNPSIITAKYITAHWFLIAILHFVLIVCVVLLRGRILCSRLFICCPAMFCCYTSKYTEYSDRSSFVFSDYFFFSDRSFLGDDTSRGRSHFGDLLRVYFSSLIVDLLGICFKNMLLWMLIACSLTARPCLMYILPPIYMYMCAVYASVFCTTCWISCMIMYNRHRGGLTAYAHTPDHFGRRLWARFSSPSSYSSVYFLPRSFVQCRFNSQEKTAVSLLIPSATFHHFKMQYLLGRSSRVSHEFVFPNHLPKYVPSRLSYICCFAHAYGMDV